MCLLREESQSVKGTTTVVFALSGGGASVGTESLEGLGVSGKLRWADILSSELWYAGRRSQGQVFSVEIWP